MLLLGFSYWKKIILGPQEIKMKKEWAYEYKISLCCFILTMRGKRSRKKPHEHFHIEGKQRFGSVKVIKCFSFLKQNFLDISPCLITTTVWWHYIDLTKPLLSDILIVSFKKWVLSFSILKFSWCFVSNIFCSALLIMLSWYSGHQPSVPLQFSFHKILF